MIAYAKFDGFLPMGYFFNGFQVLDVTLTLSNIVLCPYTPTDAP